MNIWKRIYNALCMFIGIICLEYVLDILLFKFGFSKIFPSIYDNISGAFGGATASIFFNYNYNFCNSTLFFCS